MTTTKKLSWGDPRALRALADMQRQIAADMRDLACRMVMEVAAADTERRAQEATEERRYDEGQEEATQRVSSLLGSL